MMLLEVSDGFFERYHAFHTIGLVESEVRFVGHTVGCSGVDNSLIKLEDGIVEVEDALGHLLGVGVQSHAEETLLLLDLFN